MAWGIFAGNARGWEAAENSCHACNTTTRAYRFADENECNALCDELYRSSADHHDAGRCKGGCQYMHANASSACAARTGQRGAGSVRHIQAQSRDD